MWNKSTDYVESIYDFDLWQIYNLLRKKVERMRNDEEIPTHPAQRSSGNVKSIWADPWHGMPLRRIFLSSNLAVTASHATVCTWEGCQTRNRGRVNNSWCAAELLSIFYTTLTCTLPEETLCETEATNLTLQNLTNSLLMCKTEKKHFYRHLT